MTTRPVIGIITNLDPDPNYQFPGYPRVTINEDYPRSIAASGGVPVLIPPMADRGLLADQLSLVDALVLAGGPDVDPLTYGADPQERCGTPSPLRDAFERLLQRAGALPPPPPAGTMPPANPLPSDDAAPARGPSQPAR